MIDRIFQICVALLDGLGNATGLGYEAVNVIIFVFLMPAVFLAMAARLIYLESKLSGEGRARRIVVPTLQIAGGLLLILILLAQL